MLIIAFFLSAKGINLLPVVLEGNDIFSSIFQDEFG